MTGVAKPEPVAWAVTVGEDFINCVDITNLEDDAKAQYEACTKGGYESLFMLRSLITADQAEAYAAAKVREAQQWQPIETAPKDGSNVLLRSRSGRMADGFWGVRYEVWSWPYVMTEPAYWMPLPPPPQA